MTLSEFKAWFDGFSEGIDKAPTEKQFAKIKAKVAEIDGAPVTERIYIDRYWPTYTYRYWGYPFTWGAETIGGAAATGGMTSMGTAYGYCAPQSKGDNQTVTFDSSLAMYNLGRAEAAN